MLRRLYDWCIAAADKPYATWLMGVVSFMESSFCPIPPDATGHWRDGLARWRRKRKTAALEAAA